MRRTARWMVLVGLWTVLFWAAGAGAIGAEKPVEFDAQPILAHNKAWLHPDLGHLKRVSFVHRVDPVTIRERLAWQCDGSSAVEVLQRELVGEAVGKLWVTTSKPALYYFVPGSVYGEEQSVPEQGFDRLLRDYLMGTRTNFVALDWGWAPGKSTVRDVSRLDDGHLVVQLVPHALEYHINAGATFQARSSTSVSNYRVGWGELTIDPESRRILREVDYSVKGEKCCEIEFSDWKPIGDGREVPLRIRLQASYRDGVEVDYRFQWKKEGLWVFASGQTQFQDKDPTRHEIQDLRINQAESFLDEALARVEESTSRQELPLTAEETVRLTGLHRFEFGKKAEPADADASAPMKRVLFTYADGSSPTSKWPPVVAEVEVNSPAPKADSGVEILLALLDKEGQPVLAQRTPLAALLNPDRTLAELGASVSERNAAWLSMDEKPSQMTYTFVNGEQSKEFTVDETTTDITVLHGINFYSDWTGLVNTPDRFHTPVQFNGLLDGRPLVVSALSEWCRLFWSNGLKRTGHLGGYHSKNTRYGLVVVDEETSRPLLSKYDDVEVYYLDYVELESGSSAPLRIVVFEGDKYHDFRFQIVNGRWWLFDRSYWSDELASRIESVSIDGKAAEITARCPEDAVPAGQLSRLDWSQITDRRSTRENEPQLVRDIIAQPQPWQHPAYKALLDSKISVDKSAQKPTITVQLRSAYFAKEFAYWSLAWCEPGLPPRHFSGSETVDVASYPMQANEPIVVSQVPAGSSGGGWSATATRIRSCRLERDNTDLTAQLEVVSHDKMAGILAPAAIALVSGDGRVLAAASEDIRFAIRDGIYASETPVLLGQAVGTPKHVLLGLRAKVTSGPMGSTWGSIIEKGPVFTYEQLLTAEDPRVLKRALGWLQGDLRGLDERDLGGHWSDKSSAKIALIKPYLDRLERLFKQPLEADFTCLVARLAGRSGDPRFRESFLALLEHEDANVCDAAAIGLGLLGDSRGVDRLAPVLRRPMPEDTKDWVAKHAVLSWQTDAALALAKLGDDRAVTMLGDALLDTAKQLQVDPENDSKLTGPVRTANTMIEVLGRTKSPISLETFRQVLALPVGSKLSGEIMPHLARWEDKEAVLDLFVEGISRGDYAFIKNAPRDPATTQALAEALTGVDLSVGAAWYAVRHLAGSTEPVALEALIETYETKQFYESDRVRDQLIESLAKRRGDYRGLSEAFERLCEAVDTSDLLQDPQERSKEKRNRDGRARDLVRLITGEFPVDVVVKFLRPKMESEESDAQQAIEQILAKSEAIRTAISKPEFEFPESVELLSHTAEPSVGKQSYGGRGFAVKFTRPEKPSRVFVVEFYGSRYGHSQAPGEDFHIYLLDGDQKLIQDTPIPYGRVQQGNEKWYRFVVPPVEVPREFFVGLWFNAHQTKGIYISKNSAPEQSHSYTGTLEAGYKPVTDQAEWMVRVRLAPEDVAAKLAVELAPKPVESSIPAPLLASKEDQKKAREILERLAEVNRYWLFSTPPAVKNFSYEFRLGDDKSQKFVVDAKTAGGWTRQGISYYSPLHALARDPSQVSFRRVDVTPEKVTLSYIFAKPVGIAMGTGVSGSWRGYFSTRVGEGTLVIDAARFAPLEHTAGDLHEVWADYTEQDSEHLAPRKIDILRKGMQIHWKFRLWKPGLWLFSSAGDGDPPVAIVDAVRVNGEAVKEMESARQ